MSFRRFGILNTASNYICRQNAHTTFRLSTRLLHFHAGKYDQLYGYPGYQHRIGRFRTKTELKLKTHILMSSRWKQCSSSGGNQSTNERCGNNTEETAKVHKVKKGIGSLIRFTCLSAVTLGAAVYLTYKYSGSSDPDNQDENPLESNRIKRVHDPELGKKAKLIYYKDVYLPYFMENELQDIDDFEVRDSDIWVITFPKSGTTWVQEMVYLIQNDLDVSKAMDRNMEERFSYFEFPYPGLKTISQEKPPRFIKSHLPCHLLPKSMTTSKCKKIYVVRNPRDVTVSYYHFIRMINEIKYRGNFRGFFERFRLGMVAYGPWWDHVKGYWEHRDDENMLFLKYEDLQKDPYGGVKKIAKFLGKDLNEKEVYNVAVYCSFFCMKDNPASNYSWWDTFGLRDKKEAKFLRKGIVGDWKNYFTNDMCHKMDQVVDEKLAGTGLTFEYEIPKR